MHSSCIYVPMYVYWQLFIIHVPKQLNEYLQLSHCVFVFLHNRDRGIQNLQLLDKRLINLIRLFPSKLHILSWFLFVLCFCIWFWFLVFDHVLCHVLFFRTLMCPLSFPVYFPCWISMPSCVSCPLSFSYILPSGSLCLLYCSLHVFSVLLPLVTSPGLLPPLSPHLFLVMSLVSVYLVCVFPSLPVRSLFALCLWLSTLLSMLFLTGMFWILFAFWFELCYLVCTLSYFLLVATLPLAPVLFAFDFWNQL